MMKIILGTVTLRRVVRSGPASELLQAYVQRVSRYMPCDARNFVSEEKLLEFFKIGAAKGRSALLLADSRGQQVTSEEMAGLVGGLQDGGTQQILLGIGPADGRSRRSGWPSGRSRSGGLPCRMSWLRWWPPNRCIGR
jgi:23S rRNA (pseudouridine1915-N3)-methyltransferase